MTSSGSMAVYGVTEMKLLPNGVLMGASSAAWACLSTASRYVAGTHPCCSSMLTNHQPFGFFSTTCCYDGAPQGHAFRASQTSPFLRLSSLRLALV